MKIKCIRTLSLVITTVTYLLVGAAIFDALESDHEMGQKMVLNTVEHVIRHKYNISDEDFKILTTTVIKSVPHRAGVQWKFSGALYFVITTLTTIGYGDVTPSTVGGKAYFMVYVLVGIPLILRMFLSLGQNLIILLGIGIKNCKKNFGCRNQNVTQTNLTCIVLTMFTLVLTIGAALFSRYERWNYFDSLYFCVQTLMTIGFGDYVALKKEIALQSQPEYLVFISLFFLFGLSVVSAAINLLVRWFAVLDLQEDSNEDVGEHWNAPSQMDQI